MMTVKKADDLTFLQSELMLAAGVSHGWFDRSLGNTVFRPDNPFKDPEWIDEAAMQRRRLKACDTLGLDGTNIVVTSGLLQTDSIQIVDSKSAGKIVGPADGYITTAPGLPIVLSAADCAQIIIYAPDVHAMAVVHAGGLGTARGIVTKAVQRLTSEYKADPHAMIAALGPTVGADHYVPTLDSDNFTYADIASTHPVTKKLTDGRIGYDIAATIVRQLRDSKIPSTHIEVSNIDTYAETNWYSYERDKARDTPAAMRRHGLFVALPQNLTSKK